jgi:indole-3-glycerol phosphate synthase
MSILEKIVDRKREWVEAQRRQRPLEIVVGSPLYNRSIISLSSSIKDGKGSGIIAEFKRKSPSKGNIHAGADAVSVTQSYQSAGASAVSILTDVEFFGGSDQDLVEARTQLSIPILRKEFIIDTYQIHEAKAMGADLVLLIAACLSPDQVKLFSQLAKELGLEVLLELHDAEELEHICDTVDFVGINNRSLKTFDVNIQRSLKMAAAIPNQFIKVAESGIDDPTQIRLFKENGFQAFLIGENFMKTNDPGKALEEFINQI